MKKLLALVLALVMTLGLATVSAGASYQNPYTDKDDIDFKEAAEVMSKVGVFQGKGENFAPKDNLNRAEAAKLIAYLMLGNNTAETMKGNGNRFTDVPADHYASGYIEYLAAAGIVSGVGDGKFNPNGQVTAVQFAKMLCVALGYDAKTEGYVGESWNINIMKQANKDKIFDLLSEINTNDLITREQAAQMCLNALKATMVDYESKGDELNINGATLVLNAKKAQVKTTTETAKGRAIKDDVTNSGIGTTLITPYILQLGEELYKGDLKLLPDHDDLGRPSNKWTWKNEEIGNYAKKADLRATFTDDVKKGVLYDTLGKSIYDDLVKSTTSAAKLYFFEDGYENGYGYGTTNADVGRIDSGYNSTANRKEAIEEFVLKNGDKKINYDKSTGRGAVTEVYVDDSTSPTRVTVVVSNTYVFQAASDYRSSTEDLLIKVPGDATAQGNILGGVSLNTTRLELADFPEIKDMKQDDYLLVTVKKDGTNYKVDTVAKAEKLTGKVEKVVVSDTVTIDGETLKYSAKATDDTKGNEFSVGQESTVVLDKYGWIIYVDEAVVSHNYVFISELYQNGGSTTKVRANAFFTDGTNQEIYIKKIDDESNKKTLNNAKAAKNYAKGLIAGQNYVGWYTYSKNSADEYTLTSPGSSYKRGVEYATYSLSSDTNKYLLKSDTVNFVKGTTAYTTTGDLVHVSDISAGAAKADEKTIVVVTYGDKNDVDIYTGVKNLPDIKLKAAAGSKNDAEGSVFTVVKDGYAKYVFVSLEGNYSVFGTENEKLLYIIKQDKTTKDGNDTYYTYKALDENGNEVTITGDSDSVFGSISSSKDMYKAYYKTSINSSDRYTNAESVRSTGNTGSKYVYFSGIKQITAKNGTLNIAGESFTLDSGYKLMVVSRVDALNKMKGKDYEATLMTAESLEALVRNYDITYDFEAKLKDNYDGSGKILEAYVTITSASEKVNFTVSPKNDLPAAITVVNTTGTINHSNEQNVYFVGKSTTTFSITLTSAATQSVKMSVGSGYTIASVSGSAVSSTTWTGPLTANTPVTVSLSRSTGSTVDGVLTIAKP